MINRKLGRAGDQRRAILRNQTTALLWNGKIVTTLQRAKEVRSIAEKIITLAAKEYNNNIMVTKKTMNDKSQIVEKEVRNDAPSKLHARRRMMAYLYEIPPVKNPDKKKEDKADFKQRVRDIHYPVIEKVFNELGPKYENRPGGYTRMIKMGPRRGDAAEMVILELV